MGTSHYIDPPFGHYALPERRERIRVSAENYPDTRVGRWLISLARKRAMRGLAEPYDVTVADYIKARLYPSTNRCEKRAMAGVQIWDADELAALETFISAKSGAPFVFLDIGANVGLYSLFAHAHARRAGKDIQIYAVEPNPKMTDRLLTNAAASEALDAFISVSEGAISIETGEVFLSDGDGNYGEAHLSDAGRAVQAATLTEHCWHHRITRIDAMKLDIEGQDLPVLTQFFEQAPPSLHPNMMILELDETSAVPLIELTQAHDYLIITRTRMNVVVAKRDS